MMIGSPVLVVTLYPHQLMIKITFWFVKHIKQDMDNLGIWGSVTMISFLGVDRAFNQMKDPHLICTMYCVWTISICNSKIPGFRSLGRGERMIH